MFSSSLLWLDHLYVYMKLIYSFDELHFYCPYKENMRFIQYAILTYM